VKAGWGETTLGDIVTLNYGKALAKSDRNPSGAVPVYGANGVMDWSDHYLTEGPSLVIGRKGTAGAVTAVDGPFWPADVTYYTTHDTSRVNLQFLHYGLSMLDLPSLARGVKPGINRNDVYALKIPLPPLEEQQRIVAILDEAFEGLDRAKANAEANLVSAMELFEAGLEQALSPEKMEGRTAALADEYDVRDGTHDSPKYVERGHALITSKNLKPHGLDRSSAKFISEADYNNIRKRSGVHKGDVLFAMIGTIGNPVVVNEEPDFAIKNVALFKPRKGRDGRLLRYILLSRSTRRRLANDAKGATQKFVGLGYLRGLHIHLPAPINEQSLIAELEALEQATQSARRTYESKVTEFASLRQSLLVKAFAGELI
jgi:type I restriction enzyme S subunit